MRFATHIGKLMAAVLLAMSVMLAAGAGSAHAGPPAVAKGRGDKCVAPTDWMRRNHMSVLKHQRDDTVHEGIRTTQFSLKGCIDCHAVKGSDGKPARAQGAFPKAPNTRTQRMPPTRTRSRPISRPIRRRLAHELRRHQG